MSILDQGQATTIGTQTRYRLKELGLLLVGLLVFSFLINLLSNLIYDYFKTGSLQIYLMVPIVAITLIISYLLYVDVVMLRSKSRKWMQMVIIYDIEKGEVIRDPFDHYATQQWAFQAFEKYKQANPADAQEIKSVFRLEERRKHILTDLIEYVLVLNLKSILNGTGSRAMKSDKLYTQWSRNFDDSKIISFFRTTDPSIIRNRGMQEFSAYMPEDIDIQYQSPIPEYISKDNFRIIVTGKYCTVYITGVMQAMMPIQSMQSGAAPVFMGVNVRRYWAKKLEKRLGRLYQTTFTLSIDVKARLSAGLTVNTEYLDWADRWTDRLMEDDFFFGPLDFHSLRRRMAENLTFETYETVRTNSAQLRRLLKDEDYEIDPDDRQEDDPE